MADIRPDRLTTCQSEQKSVVSRRPTVLVQQPEPAPCYTATCASQNGPKVFITFHQQLSLHVMSGHHR
jgi:hypothetical protein